MKGNTNKERKKIENRISFKILQFGFMSFSVIRAKNTLSAVFFSFVNV